MWNLAVLKGVTLWHIASRVVADDTLPSNSCLSGFCLSVFSVCCSSFVSSAETDSDSHTVVVVYRLFRGCS